MPPKKQPLLDEETVILSVYSTGSGRKKHLGIIVAFPPHLSEFDKRRVHKIIAQEDLASHSVVAKAVVHTTSQDQIIIVLSTTSGRTRETGTLKTHLAQVLGLEAIPVCIQSRARYTALPSLAQFVLVEYGPTTQK